MEIKRYNNSKILSIDKMNLRKASVEDYVTFLELNSEVQNLHAKLYPQVFKKASSKIISRKYFTQILKDKNSILIFAYEDSESAGYIFATVKKSKDDPMRYRARIMYINHIAIKKKYQTKGMATKLLDAIFKIAQKKRINNIQLDVWEKNETAIKFFEKKGFETFNLKMNHSLDI